MFGHLDSLPYSQVDNRGLGQGSDSFGPESRGHGLGPWCAMCSVTELLIVTDIAGVNMMI